MVFILTDRQKKYYDRISSLLLLSSSADFIEKQWLSDAKNAIDKGQDFKKTIIVLMQKMQDSETTGQNVLTPNVKKLFEDLLSSYGTPEPMKKSWRNSDPDYIFVPGSGRVGGGWKQREIIKTRKNESEGEQKNKVWLLILKLSFGVISFAIIFFLLVLEVIPYVYRKYGEIVTTLLILGILITLMTILAFKGRFKK